MEIYNNESFDVDFETANNGDLHDNDADIFTKEQMEQLFDVKSDVKFGGFK